MGLGNWNSAHYDRVTRHKVKTGTSFSYTDDAKRANRYAAHESLDVLKHKNGMIESRDSEEHPNSTPIVIGFDETGSMGENPKYIQSSLKSLFGMLVRQGYVSDPQIAIAAYGDAWCDKVPIQCSQFESDNRIDDNLDNIFLEECGGGNNGETSTLLAYYIANHTVTDSWQKRHKKGYAFFIGDECALHITRSHIARFIGDHLQQDRVTAEEAFGQLSEKWNVYFLLIDNLSAHYQNSREKYSDIIGAEHVIEIKSGKDAAATIASIIGACEQTANIETLKQDLVKSGFTKQSANAAVNATISLYKHNNGNIMKKDDQSICNIEDIGDLNL